MGGKRPDQYQIDNDEAGATDYKTYPDEPAEARGEELSSKGGQPIKPSIPAPGANNPRTEPVDRESGANE